jgi:hypothetical protein
MLTFAYFYLLFAIIPKQRIHDHWKNGSYGGDIGTVVEFESSTIQKLDVSSSLLIVGMNGAMTCLFSMLLKITPAKYRWLLISFTP